MGMDLVRGSTTFSLSARGWAALLDIAEANGWMPAGTLASDYDWEPGDREWNGNYLSKDYQLVTEVDALALGAALLRAAIAKAALPAPAPRDDFFELDHPHDPTRTLNLLKQAASFASLGALEIW